MKALGWKPLFGVEAGIAHTLAEIRISTFGLMVFNTFSLLLAKVTKTHFQKVLKRQKSAISTIQKVLIRQKDAQTTIFIKFNKKSFSNLLGIE